MFLATSNGLMGATNMRVLIASLALYGFCDDETAGWLGTRGVVVGLPSIDPVSPGSLASLAVL
jgi:hypothetical protein